MILAQISCESCSSGEGPYGPYFVNFLPLQLQSKPVWSMPPGTTVIVTLFDHQHNRRQRKQTAFHQRSLVELLVRLMSSRDCHWGVYHNEVWQPELIQRLRFVDLPRDNKLYADQRALAENPELPTFVLSMAAKDIAAADFDLYYEFLTRPSANVLTEAQKKLLERVTGGSQRQQVILKIGLRLTDCKMDESVMANLRFLLERLETIEHADPDGFPLTFEVTTLWFGSNALKSHLTWTQRRS